MARIIQDVDLALKALEIVYRENGAAVERLADRNGHRRKVLGKGKSVRWSDVEVHGPKVRIAGANSPKKMLFHSDLMKMCPMKIRNISEFFPDITVFYD